MEKIKTYLAGHGCGFRAIVSTARMCAKQIFDGNILCITGEYLVNGVQFILLIFIWNALGREDAALSGMALPQLMTYTLMSSVLHRELNVLSPATSSLWEGSVMGRFTRPLPVPASFIAKTIGRWWIPDFLFFGLPLLFIAPFLNINPQLASLSAGLMAPASLMLSASLGFAIDFLFAAFAMFLKDGCWVALRIREAVFSLLSGEMIPFALLPWGLGRLFAFLPFGSVAHAPLTIYTGTAADPLRTIGLQAVWNMVLWTAAVIALKKGKERMISFGG